jgi:hypothetical protein
LNVFSGMTRKDRSIGSRTSVVVTTLMTKLPLDIGTVRHLLIFLVTFCVLPTATHADQLVDMGLDLPKRGIPDRVSFVQRLEPKTRTVYANLDGPGVIRHIWVTPSNVFEGNRQTIIRIYFDDAKEPNVEAPIGDFFGVMHGREYYDVNSVFLSVKAWEGYACYFPMPFAKNARIEFEAGPVGHGVYMQCDWTRFPGQEMKEEQRFCARWRREAPCEAYGRDYFMLDADGPGRLVGFVYGVRLFDNEDRWSHGGSDNIYIDGEADIPSYLRGIGGEDSFGVGYGGALHPPDTQMFTGMPYYVHEDVGEARPAQTLVGYRFFVHDAIEFQRSIHMRFGCMRNDICSTVYWYQKGAPRPFVKLPDWPKLLTNASTGVRPRRLKPQIEVAREEVDLPLPDSGTWQVAGIFDNEDGQAMKAPVAAESAPSNAEWKTARADHGFVDFAHYFRPHQRGAGVYYNGKAAVARATIESPGDLTANVRIAWDDHLVLRVNDDPVVDAGQHEAFRPKTIPVKLRKGANVLTVKLSNTQGSNHGGWVFNLRATTPDGVVLLPKASNATARN